MPRVAVHTDLRRTFGALGDASRFAIVKLLLARPELCVSEVAKQVGITTAGVSQHMRVLNEAGIVSPKRMGQKMCYQLKTEPSELKYVLQLMNEGIS